MNSGRNVFISGSAGTGKSTLLREFLRENEGKKNIIVCAPTGLAAINVEGETIHRVFRIDAAQMLKPGDYCHNINPAVVNADVIVIDEISMCRFNIFEFVVKTCEKASKKRRNGPERRKQLIFLGDFCQLPPVIVDEEREALAKIWGEDYPKEGFAFQTKSWADLHLVNIVLRENKRQKDQDFLSHLNSIRLGDENAIDWLNAHTATVPIKDAINVYACNKDVDAKNKKEFSELPGKSYEYQAEIHGSIPKNAIPAAETIAVKCGMRVMMLVNNGTAYQNGSLGTITAYCDDYVTIKLDCGITVDVAPYTWHAYHYVTRGNAICKEATGSFTQIPIKPAYAITIHKTQGQTYDSANLNPACFAPGQLYVALSRVRDISRLHLSRPISKRDLMTCHAVMVFYSNLEESSESQARDLRTSLQGQLKDKE